MSEKDLIDIENTNEKEEDKDKEPDSIESLDDLFQEETPKKEKVAAAPKAEAKNQPAKQEEETYDIQKELEAKFDELFGAFDDDNN